MSNINAVDDGMASGYWVKTRFYQEGPILKSVTYCVTCGNAEIFRFEVDLRPIAAKVATYHKNLHRKTQAGRPGALKTTSVGFDFPGSLNPSHLVKQAMGTAKKIGRIKLVKQITDNVKKVADVGKAVLRSKITGGVLTGLAVAFPAVGAPALAAYAAGNAALAALDKADDARKALTNVAKSIGIVNDAKKAIAKLGPAVAKAGFNAHPQFKASLERAVEVVNATKSRQPELAAMANKAFAQAELATKNILAHMDVAKNHPDPVKRNESKKTLQVVKILADHRAHLKSVASANRGGVPGMLIDHHGNIVRGNFVKSAAGSRNVLYSPGHIESGAFTRVSDTRVAPRAALAAIIRARAATTQGATRAVAKPGHPAPSAAAKSLAARIQAARAKSGSRAVAKPRVSGAAALIGCVSGASDLIGCGGMPRVSGTTSSLARAARGRGFYRTAMKVVQARRAAASPAERRAYADVVKLIQVHNAQGSPPRAFFKGLVVLLREHQRRGVPTPKGLIRSVAKGARLMNAKNAQRQARVNDADLIGCHPPV